MTAREHEIHDKTVDTLLDKGTMPNVDPNMIISFSTVAYRSEVSSATGRDPHGYSKTEAYLLALEELNLTESEVDNILE